MKIGYLAAPYTHADPKIKKARHLTTNRFVHYLFSQGILVYSPLTHNIPIDEMGIHGNWETWKDFDHQMLSRCDVLIVLQLPGWEESNGVKAEMQKAKELNKPIEWMTCPQHLLENELACFNRL